MSNESTGSIIIAPRQIATGDPAGKSLENVNTHPLGDGCLCYVSTGAGKGMWQLDKLSTEAGSGTVVVPLSGPGRWKLGVSGGVASVFGRAGVVVAQSGDYLAGLVSNDSSVAGENVKEALNNLAASIGPSGFKYTVGSADSGANYTTIQAAIDAAALEGHDFADPVTVWISAGYYPENLTVPPGILLKGVSNEWGVYIDGSVTLPTSASDAVWGFEHLGFGSSISITGAAPSGFYVLNITDCKIYGQVTVANGAPAFNFESSTIQPMVPTANVIVPAAGTIPFLDANTCVFDSGDLTLQALSMSFRMRACYVRGYVRVQGESSLIHNNLIYASGTSNVIDESTSACGLYDNTLLAAVSGVPCITKTGAGSLRHGGNTYVYNATAPYITVSAGSENPGGQIEGHGSRYQSAYTASYDATSTTYALLTGLSITAPTLPAGRYKLSWSGTARLTVGDGGYLFRCQNTTDALTLWESIEDTISSTARADVSGFVFVDDPSGKTFQLQGAAYLAGATIQFNTVSFEFMRVS